MWQEMFKGGSLWGGLISGGISQLQDTRSFFNGEMEKSRYAVKTSENVTGAIGIMAGIEYGAMAGTAVLPGVGTVVGSVVGGLLGNSLGRKVGNEAGKMLVNNRFANNVAHKMEEII
ncbi:hypothetical protein ACFSL6_16750 [Paenibacillus thailandensis]|uniref:Glycine zipper domain-containing protein n=1 Tax=Paenibacillus thailandensis TaxID=393250 RepID=A0ABW5R0Y9_9BACL